MAVDTFRMKSTIEDIIKDTIKENPKATMAYILNNLHYEIGRGKYDSVAEKEIKKMPLKDRDEWYQRLIKQFSVKKGKLVESFREMFTEGLGYTMGFGDYDNKSEFASIKDIMNRLSSINPKNVKYKGNAVTFYTDKNYEEKVSAVGDSIGNFDYDIKEGSDGKIYYAISTDMTSYGRKQMKTLLQKTGK